VVKATRGAIVKIKKLRAHVNEQIGELVEAACEYQDCIDSGNLSDRMMAPQRRAYKRCYAAILNSFDTAACLAWQEGHDAHRAWTNDMGKAMPVNPYAKGEK
jgi:hypothetical protein